MKKSDNQDHSRRTLAYMNFSLQVLVATICALMTIWPDDDLFLGFTESWFYGPFLGLFIISFIMLYMVNEATIYLDRKIRWENAFVKRAVYQLMLGWTVPTIVSFFLAKFYFGFLEIDIMTTLYSKHMYFQVLGIPFILNCGYMFYYMGFFFRRGMDIAENIKAGESCPDDLIFQHKDGEVKVKPSEIAYIFAHGKNTTVQLHAGEQICLRSVSLKQVSQILKPGYFCQVNKSYIITLSAYIKHRKHDRGYLLFLRPEANEPVIVSRGRKDIFLLFIAAQQKSIA